LVKEGRSPDDIAATFGLPGLAVRRILALGNLLPRIRDLYRREKIDAATVRHLTLASKSQQKAWLALADDPKAYVPVGHQLKIWLFGGQAIPVRHALFDVDAQGGAVVADLFGEGGYFADNDAFWTAQNVAIEAKRDAYITAGWGDVIIVPPSENFSVWEYERAQKRKGGRVYVDVRANGEVIVHEGYVSRSEARRDAKAKAGSPPDKPARPELTRGLQTYVDLHRHAAVRAQLLGHKGVALRLMVAHAIVGTHLWSVRIEQQTTRSEVIAESVEGCAAEAAFDRSRRAVLDLLGFSPDAPTVTHGDDRDTAISDLFRRLLYLPDPAIIEIVAVVMGETLAAGGPLIEAVGLHVGVDMARWWRADDALFELIRDRELLDAIVAEIAGPVVAGANATEKSKVLKTIVRNHLDGADGRRRVEHWVPRWMQFPPSAYTARGGVGTVRAYAALDADGGSDEPDPAAPARLPALPAPDERPGGSAVPVPLAA
jgi:ParB family chromosome partitioning protein